MPTHGKKYREAAEKVDRDKEYEPMEALKLAQETSFTKFDGTIEVHMRLGVNKPERTLSPMMRLSRKFKTVGWISMPR